MTPPPPTAPLRLDLLGGFTLCDGAGAALPISARKARGLLVCLALDAGQPLARDRLASTLWDDVDDELARSSLRQALSALRRALGPGAAATLAADSQSITLLPQGMVIDLHRFRQAVSSGSRAGLEEGLALYRGQLLAGFDARSAALEDRLRAERTALHAQALAAVERLATLAGGAGDEAGTLAALSRWVSLDPLDESAARALMQHHAGRGRHGAALEEFRRLREALRRGLDVAPEPATERLHWEILQRRRASGAATAATESSTLSSSASSVQADLPAGGGAPGAGSGQTLPEVALLVARLGALAEAGGDPEETLALALQLRDWVKEVAAGYGGRVFDPVGADVVVSFGADRARGNEPEAAVRVALALRAGVTEQPFGPAVRASLRIGICRGPLAGEAGAGGTLPLVGGTVSRALALAGRAAAGAIMAGEEMARALGGRLQVGPVPEGQGDLQAVTVLGLDPIGPSAARAALVGRRDELALLLAAVTRCKESGRGGVLVVRGEAGIGKTRLIEEVIARGTALGFTCAAGQALDFGQRAAGRLITALTRGVLGLPDDQGGPGPATLPVAPATQALTAGQLVFLHELAQVALPPALALLAPAQEGASRQRARAEALVGLVRQVAARTPLLLTGEDVHWADADELALLAELAAATRQAPLVLLLSTRVQGDPLGPGWRARSAGAQINTVDLPALGADEARQLAGRFAGIAAPLMEACLVRAEGHPLFLEQLLRAAAVGRQELPGSVRALVLARIDPLSPAIRQAAFAAAVLGQRFAAPALAFVAGEGMAGSGVLGDDGGALAQLGLLRPQGAELAFSHALVRDAVYQSLRRSTRQQLHRRAATWFDDRDPVLHAQHLAAAEDPQAAPAYLRAARSEATGHRLERALDCAGRARGLSDQPAAVAEAAALTGALALTLGRVTEALAAYREALEFAPDERRSAEHELGIAGALRMLDRHDEALTVLVRAQARLEALLASSDAGAQVAHDDLHDALARLATLRGNICFPIGDLDACLAAHESARQHARRAGSLLAELNALGGLGDAYYQRGQMITALRSFEACVQGARAQQQLPVLLAHLPMLGMSRGYCLQFDRGLADAEEALQLAARIEQPRAELVTHLVLATLHAYRGEPAAVQASADRALELARKVGARRFEAEAEGLRGLALLGFGQREAATDCLRGAWTLAEQVGPAYCGPFLLGALALATADADERAQSLAHGQALLDSGSLGHNVIDFRLRAIEVCLRQEDHQGVRRHADALEQWTAREPLPFTDLVVRRARALVAESGGPAREMIAQLRTELREAGMNDLLPALEAGGDKAWHQG